MIETVHLRRDERQGLEGLMPIARVVDWIAEKGGGLF